MSDFYILPDPGFWLLQWVICKNREEQIEIWLDAYTATLRRDRLLEPDADPEMSEAMDIYFEFWNPPFLIRVIDDIKWQLLDLLLRGSP